jgi:hypothetical protein
MTYSTTNVWIKSGSFRLFTISHHPDTALKSCRKGAYHLASQAHEFASVGPIYGWYRAGAAQGTQPGCTKQAAFFMVATAIVVSIEVFTFRTGWGFHMFNLGLICGMGLFYTRVR